MTCRPLHHSLRLASLAAALWSCTPAMASVGGGGLSGNAVVLVEFGAPAHIAQPSTGMPAPVRMAAADCSAAAAQAAADSGGQVLSVSSRQQDGRTVCVVTVLVPGSDGGRPRKQTIVLPQ